MKFCRKDALLGLVSTRPNSDVQKCVISRLAEKADIPVAAVRTPLPDFVLPDFHFINTSDRQDIEEITDHLIEVHGHSYSFGV